MLSCLFEPRPQIGTMLSPSRGRADYVSRVRKAQEEWDTGQRLLLSICEIVALVAPILAIAVVMCSAH